MLPSTFIQPERVFVWRSKERAPKQGRIGSLEKSCSGLEKSCHHLEKSGKMLEKKIQCFRRRSYSPKGSSYGGVKNALRNRVG